MDDNETAQTSSAASWQPSASVSSADSSAPAVTPASITEDSNDDHSIRLSQPQSELSARYRLIHDNLYNYCADMWANITAIRSRGLEHTIFSASLLGIYLGFDAASSSYEIGWWGFTSILFLIFVTPVVRTQMLLPATSFTSILFLIFVTLPHLRLAVGITGVVEYRLSLNHVRDPLYEPEETAIAALEKKAALLDDTSEMFGVRYVRARTIWFFGVVVSTSLGVVEWYL